jgi:elongation factor P hydroxylase
MENAQEHLSPTVEASLLHFVLNSFESCFYQKFKTKLMSGAEEPFYQAPKDGRDALIHFRYNYLRSALHETAHWCLAGPQRLKLDDWGYWYQPDGRDVEQQSQFFKVEIKPQAIEMAFCRALGIPFDVSIDNLNGPQGPALAFAEAVQEQYKSYKKEGFPKRAELFRKALLMSKKSPSLGEG